MNLDKGSAAESEAPLAPPDWTMEVHHEGNLYTAEVQRAGVQVCRVSVAQAGLDEVAARKALADKARFWIRDYLNRNVGG